MRSNPTALGLALRKAGLTSTTPHRQVAQQLPRMVEVRFSVHEETLPALYSAIEEISNEVGSRLEAPHRYDREDALTHASKALAGLRAGISRAHAALAQVYPNDRRWRSPLGDTNYR
jgi:hypothetical protein